MRKIIAHIALLIGLVFSSSSCKENDPFTGVCFIPDVAVNEVINMDLPEYFKLQNLGEHIYLTSGNKGILLVHYYDDLFYAVERTCPYESDQSCAQVSVDSLNLQLKCGSYTDTGFVECCGSVYQLNGLLLEGPSQCSLKNYQVNLQGNTLFVNN